MAEAFHINFRWWFSRRWSDIASLQRSPRNNMLMKILFWILSNNFLSWLDLPFKTCDAIWIDAVSGPSGREVCEPEANLALKLGHVTAGMIRATILDQRWWKMTTRYMKETALHVTMLVMTNCASLITQTRWTILQRNSYVRKTAGVWSPLTQRRDTSWLRSTQRPTTFTFRERAGSKEDLSLMTWAICLRTVHSLNGG